MENFSYKVAKPNITLNAFQVAQQVQDLIAEQKADRRNTIVMVGETHTQLPHQLWELSFLRANHYLDPNIQFFDELERAILYDLEKGYIKKDFYKTACAIGDQHFTKLTNAAYCLTQFVSYQPIDSSRDYLSHNNLLQAAPDNYKQKYGSICFFNDLFKNYPEMFTQNNVNCRSSLGMLQRDFAMAGRIDEKIGNTKAFSISVNGRAHLGQPRALAPNLTEMLLHTGKNILTIHLTEGNKILDTEFKEQRQRIIERLPNDMHHQYLGNINVVLPYQRSPEIGQEKAWRKLENAQQETSFEILTPLPKPGLLQTGIASLRHLLFS